MGGIIKKDPVLFFSLLFLTVVSFLVLRSISPGIFPLYILTYIIGFFVLFLFSAIDFEIVRLFAKPLYIISIILLLLPLIIGTVTRGTVRWVQLGPVNFQPAEIVRPFLLVFFAHYLTASRIDLKRFLKGVALLALPVFLILVQPSLGVSLLTVVGFTGVLIATNFNKKYILVGIVCAIALMPVAWQVMQPYQRARVETFFEPSKDPLGAGYNSLQSMITAGSGKLFGLGLGHGIQTQLSFLPEKETDFVFAAIAEELGFLGAMALLITTFIILYRLTVYMENSVSGAGRAYISGFFMTFIVQIFIHVGMNMGLTPVTGVPYPLVSAGGSSLIATMIGLGIAASAYKS
jgi:rod shape determining protein RodA